MRELLTDLKYRLIYSRLFHWSPFYYDGYPRRWGCLWPHEYAQVIYGRLTTKAGPDSPPGSSFKLAIPLEDDR